MLHSKRSKLAISANTTHRSFLKRLLFTALPVVSSRKLFIGAFAAAAFLTAGAASASTITISNGQGPGAIGALNAPFNAMGEVFTAPVTGTLTSFTLTLYGGVLGFFGGVGTWNGGPDFVSGAGSPMNLYQSADVVSTTALQFFTFNPDISVTAGMQYVAYLSVFGISNGNAYADMTLHVGVNNAVAGINYFVANSVGDPRGNSSWDFGGDVGTATFSATFTAVPEPSIRAMMLIGFASLVFVGYRRGKRNRPSLAA